ncbi:MAG: hypothetical protein KA765_15260 [Thermoflexales bacterium]|nr:hypothetical protein [Thermoflexales bacterium]
MCNELIRASWLEQLLQVAGPLWKTFQAACESLAKEPTPAWAEAVLRHGLDLRRSLDGIPLDTDEAQIIAHDLQKFLTGVLGAAELYKDYPLEEDRQAVLEVLQIFWQKLSAAFEQVELLAESLRAEIHIEPLEMAALVSRAEARVRETSEFSLVVRQPAQWPNCLGYAPWVEKIWFDYLYTMGDLLRRNMPDRIEVVLDASQSGDGCAQLAARQTWSDDDLEILLIRDLSRYGNGPLRLARHYLSRLGGRVYCSKPLWRLEPGEKPDQERQLYFTLPLARAPFA